MTDIGDHEPESPVPHPTTVATDEHETGIIANNLVAIHDQLKRIADALGARA